MTIPYDTALKKGQIRLLQVTSFKEYGAGQSAVVCTQEIVDLASEPEYYALSYAWGMPHKKVVWENDEIKEITEDWEQEDLPPNDKFVVDGKDLYMAPSLLLSLSDFADLAVTSWIWIDALCIRQDDEAEKAMQIQAMNDVYASAIAVLISLGPADFIFPQGSMNDVLEVIDCLVPNLRKANAADHSVGLMLNPASLSDGFMEAKAGIGDLRRKLMAFVEFCTIFQWFHRIWCIQEVVLARAVVVRCGERNVSWEAMEELVVLLKAYDWTTSLYLLNKRRNGGYGSTHITSCGALAMMCHLRSIVQDPDSISAAFRPRELPHLHGSASLIADKSDVAWIQKSSPISHRLRKPTQANPSAFALCATLLSGAQFAKCSNDFDRVYGLLGVFDTVLAEHVSTLIDVDYTGSVSTLYLKVMALLMLKSESLDLVTRQFPEVRDQQQSSWVFDLRKHFPQSGVGAAEGDGCSRGTKEIYESRSRLTPAFQIHRQELHVFGGDLDRVSHVLGTTTAPGGTLDALEKIATILQLKNSKRPSLEPIWKTLIWNRWAAGAEHQPSPEVEIHFRLFLVYETVRLIAYQDKENKVDDNILAMQIRRFADILSQFDLADTSLDMDHALCILLLRHHLQKSREVNDLNRGSTRDYKPVAIELIRYARPFIHRMMGGMAQQRILFVSERGLIGSAPESTQIGDSIWILCGATTPWVLRPAQRDGLHMPGVQPDSEKYTFIGDAYVHDMMEGEALQKEEYGLKERLRRVVIV